MMSTEFDPRTAPDSFYDEQIKRLAVRLQAEMDAVAKTEEELRWWRDGRRIFVEEVAEDGLGFATDANEITPPSVAFETGARPTTRQAIMSVLIENRAPQMRAAEISAEIDRRGWSPGGEYWKNSIRNKIRDLVEAGELVKVDTGIYALSEAARAREGITAPVGSSAASDAAQSSSAPRGAVSSTVLDVVRQQGAQQPLRPAQVRKLLAMRGIEADSNAVRVALRRWADRGQILKHKDGTYSPPITNSAGTERDGMPVSAHREIGQGNGMTVVRRDPGEI